MNANEHLSDAEYFEEFAANKAWISARDVLSYAGTPLDDMQAATVAALWLALEKAAEGLSKDALRRMVFGEEAHSWVGDPSTQDYSSTVDAQSVEEMEQKAFDAWYMDHFSKPRPWFGTRELLFKAWKARAAIA